MEGPDKGWAWVVVFAACCINLIMNGQGRMSGILYVAFIDLYGVDRRSASLPFSIRTSTRNLLGPVAGILGQKYGVQGAIFFGGIMATICTALCFFAPDIKWITISWAGLGGIGTALTMVQIQVVIGQYFKKNRATAAGISFSGACVGSFLFPVLIQWLLKSYGIEGTFLILGGIVMHTIPAGMVLKKPTWLKRKHISAYQNISKKEKIDDSINIEDKVENLTHGILDIQFLRNNSKLVLEILTSETLEGNQRDHSFKFIPKDARDVEEICILETLEEIYSFLQIYGLNDSKNACDISLKEDIKSASSNKIQVFYRTETPKYISGENSYRNKFLKQSVSNVSKLSKDLSKNYIQQKIRNLLDMNINDIQSLYPYECSGKILKITEELQKLNNYWSEQNDNLHIRKDTSVNDENYPHSFWDHFKMIFRLMLNPLFLLICMCRISHFITFLPMMTTVVDFTLDRGFHEEEGSIVIAVLSFGDLLGRLCLGWVTDKGFMDVSRFMLGVMILQGINVASLPFMSTKEAIYTSLCIFGLLQGSLFIRHSVLVQKYVGNNAQSIAMGCMDFFPGLLGLGLPVYIGYFRDTLGTYNSMFYINGAVSAFVGLFWVFEPYFVRCNLSTDKLPE